MDIFTMAEYEASQVSVEKVIKELLELNVIKLNADDTLEITLLGRKVLSGIIGE